MAWGKAQQVLALVREEVRGRLKPEIVEEAYTVTDARQQALLDLTPAQRIALRNLLADLDEGTATTLQHQRATAKLIRMFLREAG